MINAILMKVLFLDDDKPSRFGGTYFVMKFKELDTGKYYDLEPSSNINEYEQWKQLARDHIGSIFEGLLIQDEKTLIKRKLPTRVTVPKKEPIEIKQQALL